MLRFRKGMRGMRPPWPQKNKTKNTKREKKKNKKKGARCGLFCRTKAAGGSRKSVSSCCPTNPQATPKLKPMQQKTKPTPPNKKKHKGGGGPTPLSTPLPCCPPSVASGASFWVSHSLGLPVSFVASFLFWDCLAAI